MPGHHPRERDQAHREQAVDRRQESGPKRRAHLPLQRLPRCRAQSEQRFHLVSLAARRRKDPLEDERDHVHRVGEHHPADRDQVARLVPRVQRHHPGEDRDDRDDRAGADGRHRPRKEHAARRAVLDAARSSAGGRNEHHREQKEHPRRFLVVEEQEQHVPDGDELRRAADGSPDEISFEAEAAPPREDDRHPDQPRREQQPRQRDVRVAQESRPLSQR